MSPDNPPPGANSLPSNQEAEQRLIGAVMFDNSAMESAERIKRSDFFEPLHGRLWEAMARKIAAGRLAEPVTLADEFRADEAFAGLGGIRYLADLLDAAPPGRAVASLAQTVADVALARSLALMAREIEATALSGETGANTLEAAEKALHALAETGEAEQGFADFATSLDGAMRIAEEAYQRQGELAGMATGLIDLDQRMGGLVPSNLLVLAARPSMGKAQPLDAKVLMRDGTWRAMGDLKIGDELASIDGEPSRVAGIFPQGARQTYRMTLGDGRSTRSCDEHLWSIASRRIAGGQAVVSTAKLREMLAIKRYQRRISLPLISGDFGADDGLKIDPWLLGALIGNGGLTGNNIMFSTADPDTLNRVKASHGAERVVSAGGLYDHRLKQCGDPALNDALKAYGLSRSRSETKFIPPEYLKASRNARLELLRGLIDTDGWVEAFGVVRYCTASPRLASDIQTLIRSLGGSCTITTKQPHYTYKGERKAGQVGYVCNIRHADRASLMSLERKKARCRNEARFKAPTIVSIEPAAIEPVQCIKVTHPSALYVTDDYIVTHNTALATNIAYHLARQGKSVGFFSLEMSKEELGLRILADASEISSDRIRKGKVDMGELMRLRDCRDQIASLPLHIDETGAISLARLTARARRLQRKKGLDLIIVDYLQLITTGQRGDNRATEVGAITGGLKALAKDLKVPVIALSQLSRQVENRPDKRPQLSDLRESGSIEQDADVVMFVYRESYYLSRAEPDQADEVKHLEWQDKLQKAKGQAEVIIGKARHGPIGTVRLSFNEDLTRFGNLAREQRYEART